MHLTRYFIVIFSFSIIVGKLETDNGNKTSDLILV
jgi:hypothetical protein